MRALFSPKGIVLTAAFLSFVLSVFIWFVIGDRMMALFVGIGVPSILATGAVVPMTVQKGTQQNE